MIELGQAPEIYLDPNKAIETLTLALRNGYLTVFIGAGVSKSATSAFPDWVSLVRQCCEEADVHFDEERSESNEYLRQVVEDVERKYSPSDFLNIVERFLYEGVEYNIQLMKTDLLVSLGSIVMNSLRGGARAVVNYNFDDLLEWYLAYHGFCIDVVSMYPTLLRNSDVSIYHPHGFLPRLDVNRDLRTRDIVFSEQKYQRAMTSEVSPWNEVQRALLGCTLGLFVGLSGEDPHIAALCDKVYNQIIGKKRIIGFQVLKDEPKSRDKEGYNLSRGIVNVYISDYTQLPEFLLSICRSAAGLA